MSDWPGYVGSANVPLDKIYVHTYFFSMGRRSFRDQLIASAVQTVRERGFATVGVREITSAAGVAQGSFTNHFNSKEEFGLAVLDRYAEENRKIIEMTLNDVARRPLERLHAYFDAAIDYFSSVDWRYGCLAGNMALEASEHSEMIRQHLESLFRKWTDPFVKVIEEAKAAKQVRSNLDVKQSASALLEAWQGAMLRMKVDRAPDALYRFKRLVLPALLPGPPHR